MSNSLDSVQARNIVGPDLGPNCLQRLSADSKSRHKKAIITTAADEKYLIFMV